MKVVLDTNVLISATFWNGDSSKIMEKIEKKELDLVTSKEIIEEYIKVLEYKEIQEKIKNKNLEMKRTIEKIISISIVVEPQKTFEVVKEDPGDNKFLDCAFEGNVDFIISQDKHLLKLKIFSGIQIFTPIEFLKLFNWD